MSTSNSVKNKTNLKLSFAQESLWRHYKLYPNNTSYNISLNFKVQKMVNVEMISLVLNEIVRRHESFRTIFFENSDGAQRIIMNDLQIDIHYLDLSSDMLTSEQYYMEEVNKEGAFCFNLERGPLINAKLIKYAGNNLALIITTHHIVFDGISRDIFLNEFDYLYQSLLRDGQICSSRRLFDYSHYVDNEQALILSGKYDEYKEYWKKVFYDYKGMESLPYDYKKTSIPTFNGDRCQFVLNHDMTKSIYALSKKLKSTPYILLLAVFKLLQRKYTGNLDIVTGITCASRESPNYFDIIGFMANTTPIRCIINDNSSFSEFALELRNNVFSSSANSTFLFNDILSENNIYGLNGLSQLFNTICTYRKKNRQLNDAKEKLLVAIDYYNNTAKYDLVVDFYDDEDSLYGQFEFNADLFKKDTIVFLIEAYKSIISQIALNPEAKISELVDLNAIEEEMIQFPAITKSSNYNEYSSVLDLFEKQVKNKPKSNAVFCGNNVITYLEIDHLSNQVANMIVAKGIEKNSIVAICVQRSIELIACIIGVLKAGCSYLPLDSLIPQDRLANLINGMKIDLLITETKTISTIFTNNTLLFFVDTQWQELRQFKTIKPELLLKSTDLAYIVYTSGSTGEPKCAGNTHAGLKNLMNWYTNELKIFENEKFILITPIGFDLAQKNVFGALTVGAELHLLNDPSFNISRIVEIITLNKISVLNTTPSVFQAILMDNDESIFQKLSSLRHLILGGEPIKLSILKKWIDSKFYNATIVNSYGPSECSDVTTYHIMNEENLLDDSFPIGKPIPNTKAFLIDDKYNILPPGRIGEICLAGVCVGVGYLNDKILTQQKFISSYLNDRIDGCFYRTGDLGMMGTNGEISYLNRIDYQVKINGIRTELGEIEAHIEKFCGVKQSIVIASDVHDNSTILVAFIVPSAANSFSKLSIDHLKESLQNKLLFSQIPTQYIIIDSLPLTVNGKVDRKELIKKIPEYTQLYSPPSNIVELQLQQIWSTALKMDSSKVSIDHNIFSLGGNSLTASNILLKIKSEFSIELNFKDFILYPTIKSLGEMIGKRNTVSMSSIVKTPEKTKYLASTIQKRLYALQRFNPESTAYNIPIAYKIKGDFCISKFRKNISLIVERHEILRTIFSENDGEIEQKIINDYQLNMVEIKLSEKIIEPDITHFIKPFNLNEGPLYRITLLEINSDIKIIIFDFHHIVMDGVSINLFFSELNKLNRNIQLEKVELQFKDFSEWQNSDQWNDRIATQEKYWTQQFTDELPILNLPLDYKRPKYQSFDGNRFAFNLDAEQTDKLRKLMVETNTTYFVILLSVFYIFLSKISGAEDIIVGSPFGGRTHGDLQNIYGMFANTLPIRNSPSKNKSFLIFLKDVMEKVNDAIENQDFPFEKIVNQINNVYDASRNPIFDVMFTCHTIESQELIFDDLEVVKINPFDNYSSSKFDLMIVCSPFPDRIDFWFEYCTSLFHEKTISHFSSYFKNIVNAIIENPNSKISNIPIIALKEKEQVLFGFNSLQNYNLPLPSTREMFENEVNNHPNTFAISYNGIFYTYDEVNKIANKTASYLRDMSSVENPLICIILNDPFIKVLTILAILKLNGAYLPIDCELPEQRIIAILGESKVDNIITSKDILCTLSEVNSYLNNSNSLTVKYLSNDLHEINEFPDINHSYKSNVEHMVYVMYTSGSTGVPKGVIQSNRSLSNLIHYQKFCTNIDYGKILQFASISFDVSFQEIFSALDNGGTLYLISDITKKNIPRLLDYINLYGINTLFLPPAFLKIIINSREYQTKFPECVKHIICAGERLEVTDELRAILKTNSGYLHNHYGPTETHVVTTLTMDGNENIPDYPSIGKPLINNRIYILDNSMMPCPIGILGEIYIGGRQLSKGYYRNEELTNTVYNISPFDTSERLYKTGDLGKWLNSGDIEFCGRKDFQIKIRGYRVEIGDIESCLMKYSVIESCLVRFIKINEENHLVAYYISETEYSHDSLYSFMYELIPDYMIPSYFIYLTKFPLNQNGKVDFKKLPLPLMNHENNESKVEMIINPIEEVISKIWSEVLKVENPKMHDNFIKMGGHSLKAIQVVSWIDRIFQTQLPIRDLFRYPTICELSKRLKEIEPSHGIYEKIAKIALEISE